MDIVHQDIHSDNVLIYKEEGRLVAKWADFGMGFVGKDKQFRFKRSKPTNIEELKRMDLLETGVLFKAILRDREISETANEKHILDELQKLSRDLTSGLPLFDVYQKYRHYLEDDLDLE